MNYYKSQLDKLECNTEYAPTVKVYGGQGNSTKFLSVNLESIDVFIEALQSYKQTLLSKTNEVLNEKD